MPPDAYDPTTEGARPDAEDFAAVRDRPGCLGVMGLGGRYSGVGIGRLDEQEEDKTVRPNPKYSHMFYVAARNRRDADPN